MKKSFREESKFYRMMSVLGFASLHHLYEGLKTRRNLSSNRGRGKESRYLEIGPGLNRIPGFETLNVIDNQDVDYILDISKKTPFYDGEFSLVYASHVLEHIPWYLIEDVFSELNRILKPGGSLEVWVPNGLKICEILTRFENEGIDNTPLDGWYKFNLDKDPCVWASGRLYTYGDGLGTVNSPNWHRCLFTPRYLIKLFERSGFEHVNIMKNESVRGYDHGWINLGVKAFKKIE